MNEPMTDKRMQAAYDSLHQESDLRFPLQDYPHFFDWLNLPCDSASLSLLDIACGQGFFLEAAEQRTQHVRLEGVDFSSVGLAKARARLTRSHLVAGSAYDLPYPSETFDYVVNLGSLEHFTDPTAGLKEMGRVLKMNGKGLVIVPNRYYLGNLWRVYAYGEEDDQGQEGLCQFNTVRGWERHIKAAGLDPVCVRGYNGEDHIAWYFKRRSGTVAPPELMYRELLDTFVKPAIPLNLSQCFAFFVRRQPEAFKPPEQ